jgi:uncharacterized membrane protein YbaN (DUF454 family)
VKQVFYKPLGFVFLGLAILGILLPIIPGTPFLLLSAWFFARSSEKWHSWLLNSELFGPMIRNWEDNHCISCRIKVVAIGAMAVAGSISVVYAVQSPTIKIVGLVMMSIGTTVILLIKTCPAPPVEQPEGDH